MRMAMVTRRIRNGPDHHDQLFWSIRGIQSLLEEIHGTWAVRIGVTSPQLMMIFALRDFDAQGNGLPVKEVARILSVDPTFITTQSKVLEAKGFFRRTSSSEDGRVVRLSLSDKALKQLANLSARQKKLTDYIFAELTEQGIQALVSKVLALKIRMEKASAIASIDLDD
jgi:DNA-binding MarR family transcriptional regulator